MMVLKLLNSLVDAKHSKYNINVTFHVCCFFYTFYVDVALTSSVGCDDVCSGCSINSEARLEAVAFAAFHKEVAEEDNQLQPACAFCLTSSCKAGSVSFVFTVFTPLSTFSVILASFHVCTIELLTDVNVCVILSFITIYNIHTHQLLL